MMRPELDEIRTRRRAAIATATGSAGRVLAMIEHLVATSACPMERRALRLQAVAIRRRMLAILKAPDPFREPTTTVIKIVDPIPTGAPRVPRRVVSEPIERGGP